jgi:glycosyltransferase involved in cell wall biosynthesis
MKIGIDARFYGAIGKGLGRYTEKLIEHLEASDTENEYVIFLRRENFDAYQPKYPRFSKARADYQWYSFSEQCLFPFFLRRFQLDLMHFPHFNVPLLYRRKFVVTIHDLILLRYPTLRNTTHLAFFYWLKFAAYRMVIASAIGRANHVITVSDFAKRDILDRYPSAAGKVSVTYEAADAFCRILPASETRSLLERLVLMRYDGQRDILQPYFLYVGNAYPHKNLQLLLDVAKRFPKHQFVLVGREDYFYIRLKREAKQYGIDNVIFTGFISDQELSALYRNALAYVFPSLYEGFGLPPLDAMTFGLPVASSDRASLPEILGDAAVYFNPENPGSLEQTLVEIANNPVRQEALRQRGYDRVKHFHWRSMAEATLRIYAASSTRKQTI